MYLYHYAMRKLPFGHTPDTSLFCQTNTHSEALNVLLFSINSGEAFCKIIAEVGCGKTMLCRVLIRKLEKERKFAYIPNPNLNPLSLQFTLAKELGLRIKGDSRNDQITLAIQNKLIKLNQQYGPVVLIIDEAQAMSDEALETLRLFTNIETEKQKLLQIVLFAQPELDKKLASKHLRQLKQRITFSYRIKKLSRRGVLGYIRHRLACVSIGQSTNISPITAHFIHYFSKGTPRIINTLCHKALLLGFAKKQRGITLKNVIKSAADTESVDRILVKYFKPLVGLVLLSLSGGVFAYWGGI